MEYRLLRQFDAAVRKYYLRLKEISVAEKYGRPQMLAAAAEARQEYYGERIRWIDELVQALEAIDVPAHDFHACRDDFAAAGKALQAAYRDFAGDAGAKPRALAEFAYYLDNALLELKGLWARYHAGEDE